MNFIRTLKKIFKVGPPRRKTPPHLKEIDAVLVDPPTVSFILKSGTNIIGVYKTWREASRMSVSHRGSKILKVVNPIVVEGRIYKGYSSRAKCGFEVIG